MLSRRRKVSMLVLAVCMMLGGGASASVGAGPPKSASAAVAGKHPTITIMEFSFVSVPDHVGPGATITVVNQSKHKHTVSSDDAAWTGVYVDRDQRVKTFTAPSKPGQYRFHCTFHSSMRAVLTVTKRPRAQG